MNPINSFHARPTSRWLAGIAVLAALSTTGCSASDEDVASVQAGMANAISVQETYATQNNGRYAPDTRDLELIPQYNDHGATVRLVRRAANGRGYHMLAKASGGFAAETRITLWVNHGVIAKKKCQRSAECDTLRPGMTVQQAVSRLTGQK